MRVVHGNRRERNKRGSREGKGRRAGTPTVQGRGLKKEVAIYSSRAKSGPPLAFVNKVLLAHNDAHLFTYGL